MKRVVLRWSNAPNTPFGQGEGTAQSMHCQSGLSRPVSQDS